MFNVKIIRLNCGPEGAAYQFQTPQGTLAFNDVGHQQYVPPYNWGVTFSYGGNEFLYSYNGQGDITFVFDDEGHLSAQCGDNGTITPLNSEG
jgi:hypothetical protein